MSRDSYIRLTVAKNGKTWFVRLSSIIALCEPEHGDDYEAKSCILLAETWRVPVLESPIELFAKMDDLCSGVSTQKIPDVIKKKYFEQWKWAHENQNPGQSMTVNPTVPQEERQI